MIVVGLLNGICPLFQVLQVQGSFSWCESNAHDCEMVEWKVVDVEGVNIIKKPKLEVAISHV